MGEKVCSVTLHCSVCITTVNTAVQLANVVLNGFAPHFLLASFNMQYVFYVSICIWYERTQ